MNTNFILKKLWFKYNKKKQSTAKLRSSIEINWLNLKIILNYINNIYKEMAPIIDDKPTAP